MAVVSAVAAERIDPVARRALRLLAPDDQRDYVPWKAPLELTFHPSCKRITATLCPFSGMTNDQTTEHVTGILRMIDEADRRKA